MARPPLTTTVLVSAAAMLAVWIACDRALAGALPNDTLRATLAALAAATAGALVSRRLGPDGSQRALSKMADAVRAMRRGDFTARAPVPERSPLAPLSTALNDLAADLGASIDASRKERDLLSGILDGMAEGVIVFDRDGHIILANLAARRIAVSGDDVIGKSAIEALRNAALAEAVGRALEKGETSVREVEMGGVLPRRLFVRLSERAGAPEGGGGVIAVLHDVTDLRRLETIRTDFVANVSHELRTPVTAITTAADTLLGGALADPKDAAEFVEMIERNAQRLRRLVEDLLDLSKIEGKAYKLAPAEVPLGSLFEQGKKLVQDAAQRRRMRVIVEPRSDVCAWIDRHAFEQVLGNLLDNAVKYAGEGASVSVSAREEGDSVVVSVADTGAGIAPQHLGRLFERFYRADAGRSREMGGTGLGLAIVKHLVESMRGTISVKSTLGRGTTFTMVLPRTPER
jgi:two-component system phosphate regulon sensor histidine kinase PhoR